MDKRRPLEDRYFEKVDRSGGEDTCWPWIGASQVEGYGTIYLVERDEKVRATHVAWFLEHGVWPDKFMCHTCDNPPCCNPRHLFEGDAAVNNRDSQAKGRKPRGLDHVNTKVSDADVIEMRRRYAEGESVAAIARDFPVSYAHTWSIVNYRCRKHVA